MVSPRPQIITEARASGAPLIENSLKFDQISIDASPGSGFNHYQHLYKRMPRYGNDRCWTWSAWLKRAQIYGQNSNSGIDKQYVIASEGDTSASFIRFNNDNGADTLRIYGPNSDLITEANFRDVEGWYHIVVAVDTTQATAANRVKLYVNGVQFSDWWSSGNTFPPQNQDYTFFDEVNHLYLGYSTTDSPNHNTFRGWMSEVYMLPGAQYQPTDFGFNDPLTGTWRPKKFNFDRQYQAVFNAPFSSIPSTDSSGNSITITDPSSGGVSVASAGANNFGITNALDFGGGNDDLIVCGSSAFDGTGTIDMSSDGYTIDFYLKADGDLASGHSPLTLYFDPGVASGDRACRFYMDGNALVLGFTNTSGCTLTANLNTDWHHVRLSGSGIWFDGTYVANDADFTRLIGLNTAVRVLYGGYNSVTAATYKWQGMLGPLRIMNGDLGAPPSGGLVTNSGNLPNGAGGGPSGMSLYLPFDGARPIGENQRRDPSFDWDLTPVNFGGSKTTSSATGAYPTYDTISGGRIIRGGIRGTVGIGVTVYNSKYYLDGEEAPSLSQHRGQTITFNTSDSTVSGHPFRFATAADAAGSTEYTKSIVTGASESSAGAATTITIPHDAPNTLYYYCTNHSGMGGSIGLSTDHKIADPCAWKCMFATPLIWDQNDVSASIAATITSNLAVTNNNVEWPRIESQFYPNAAQFVNGSSRYLTPTYNDDAFEFSTMGDFTIEGWIYHTSNVSGGSQIFGTATSNTYQCGISVIQHGGYPGYCLNVEFNANSPTRFRSIVPFPLFQWHHFAFVRHSGTGYLYMDGILQESKSLTVSDASNVAYIGRPAHDAGAYRWNGYISDFKIYNGVAKYTSEFIPASTDPDIQLNSPSGVVHSSKLGKLKTGGVSCGTVEAGYMTVVEDADWDFGTGDYTAEAWVYMTGTDNYVFATLISGSWWGLNFWTNNSSWSIRAGYNSKHEYTGIRWNYRQWYHIAVSRKSGTSMLFLDGKLIDSQSDTDNLDSTGALQIGRDANSWNKKFSGVISNARIVKGRALYTGNFTVPTEPLKNVSDTVLLCCQSQTSVSKAAVVPDTGTGTALLNAPLSSTPFADSSSTGATITNTGSIATASAGTNSFNITNAASLDGSSQRLGTNNTNMSFTGNWTLDAWFKLDSSASGYNALFNTGYGSQNTYMYFSINDDEKPYIEGGSAGGTTTAANAINKNQWYHMRVRCHGSNIMQYIDGTLVATHGNNTTDMSSLGTKTIGSLLDNGNNANNFHGLIGPVRYVGSDLGPPPFGGLATTSGALSNTPAIPALNAGTSDTVPQACNVFDAGGDIVMGNSSSYATLNPLVDDDPGGHQWRFYQNNLKLGKGASQAWATVVGNVGFKPTGKWQYECTPRPRGSGQYPYNVKVGWVPQWKQNQNVIGGGNGGGTFFYDMVTGGACKYAIDGGTQTTYGPAIDSPGEVMTLALDFENKVARLAVDGIVWPDIDISDSELLTQDVLAAGFVAYYGDADNFWDFNFGQKPFQYSFGEDYQTICTANSYEPGQARADRVFNVVSYTGNNGTSRGLDVGLQADLVFIKRTNAASDWVVQDSVRGWSATKKLSCSSNQHENDTDSQSSYGITDPQWGYINGQDSNQLKLTIGSGTGDQVNLNNAPYVAYSWKAGGSKGTWNKDGQAYASAAAAGLAGGSISPTGASVGTKEGLSILQWTATGANATISHGLTKAPEFVVLKNMSVVSDWWTYHSGLNKGVDPEDYYVTLNASTAEANDATAWQDTKPSSTLLTLGANYNIANSGNSIIAYCWHSIPGVQKFGYYLGNGDVDGPYITLGFKPALLIYKKQNGGENWQTYDNVQNLWNPTNKRLRVDIANGQDTGNSCDMSSDGFRIMNSDSADNTNDSGYIYMAWAYNPFHNLYGATAPAF